VRWAGSNGSVSATKPVAVAVTLGNGDVITAEQGCSLMCISGTADVLEQRSVVDVADISLVESQVAGETASE